MCVGVCWRTTLWCCDVEVSEKNTYLSVLISFSLSSTNYYISIYHTTNWHWGILVLEPCSKTPTFLTLISAFKQKILSCFIPLKELRLRYLPSHSSKSPVTWQLYVPCTVLCILRKHVYLISSQTIKCWFRLWEFFATCCSNKFKQSTKMCTARHYIIPGTWPSWLRP